MNGIDWAVLLLTLGLIVSYGVWKSRHHHNFDSFFLANKQLPWYHVLLSVMATQASAITFLSLPGMAYGDGMRFVQFYFGLPLAMIVLSVTFVPVFHKLRVYTAYEFLETRFDHRTRAFTALLFLLSRGLDTGISIYAPAIVLSAILHVSIAATTVFIGVLVIVYTVYGGTRAVSHSQLLQMAVIFSAVALAGYLAVRLLPGGMGLGDALKVAGAADRMNVIDWTFDLDNRYNVWSGLIGGFFLQLSYFGTDQSQVGRYLTGRSVTQSRLGLLLNGLVKIPMQFFILLIGIAVFVFYQVNPAPVFFNENEIRRVQASDQGGAFRELEAEYEAASEENVRTARALARAFETGDEEAIAAQRSEFRSSRAGIESLRERSAGLMKAAHRGADTNDTNYVFLYFVTHHFPPGLTGLVVAVIFLASMGSLAAGLNSLASSTAVDIYMRSINRTGSARQNLNFSRWATLAWGLFCIVSALYAGQWGNLIEVVNIIGSLFYGTILGIFVVAFYFKRVRHVFYAAVAAEAAVVALWWFDALSFLWLNLAGCGLVVVLSLLSGRGALRPATSAGG
jgi:Na+/proline symporter